MPSATKLMAVMGSLRPMTQPKSPANSPTRLVSTPMKKRLAMKAGKPRPRSTGGTSAKSTFQRTVRRCQAASAGVGGPPPRLGCRVTASTNCFAHEPPPWSSTSSTRVCSCRLISSRSLSSESSSMIRTMQSAFAPSVHPPRGRSRWTYSSVSNSGAQSSTMLSQKDFSRSPSSKCSVPARAS